LIALIKFVDVSQLSV